jgi:type VI secretion system protein ImpH
MASTHRPARDPLIGRLLSAPAEADFHRAIHLLQASVADSVPVGRLGPAEHEALRFRPQLGLAFPSATLADITERGKGFQIEASFLGLYGISSPLPAYVTENLLHSEDPTVERGFLDIFHHRLYSLFHRCWERMHIELGYRGDGGDQASRRLMGFAGLRYENLGEDRITTPGRLMGLAGALSGLTRSVTQIEAALQAWFPQVPMDIEPCVGTWVAVPPDQQNRLGRGNCRLGVDCSLSNQVFDRASTFGIAIGPVPLDTYLRFLPSGDLMTELREVVDLLNSDSLDYRIELRIKPEDAPRLMLEGLFSSDQTRLGWSTWLGEPPTHPDPVTFLITTWVHHG